MSPVDYVIDVLLIAVVLRQIRPRPLTPGSVLLPLGLVLAAGARYLHGVPTGGRDLVLVGALAGAGVALGVVSGWSSEVGLGSDGVPMARAGLLAAAAWVLGMGLRLAFSIWAETGPGQASIVGFSREHTITDMSAWTTALVLMAFGEVTARVVVLHLRRRRVLARARRNVDSGVLVAEGCR